MAIGRARLLFMAPQDIALFLRSARTDAGIARVRAASGARHAFEMAYAGSADPWGSASPRYLYQRLKYAGILELIPKHRRFRQALDIGSGLGLLSQALTQCADEVFGVDIAQAAVEQATRRAQGRQRLRFAQGDVTALGPELDGSFDLVVIADTLYYLDNVDDASLKAMAARIARLLTPDGLCVLANHYFFPGDADSRLTRRIHDAFSWSPDLRRVSEHWRPFYLVTLLHTASRHTAWPADRRRGAPAETRGPIHPDKTKRLPLDKP